MGGKGALIAIILTALVVGGIYFSSGREARAPVIETEDATSEEGFREKRNVEEEEEKTQPDTVLLLQVIYTCADNHTLQVGFSEGLARIDLPDGRSFTLERTLSGSGERFSSEDGGIAFWTKGNEAFLQEDGEFVYVNCVAEAEF